MAHDTLPNTPIDTVRLPAGMSEADYEAYLQGLTPDLAGSLLTWLHDDWYALAPGVKPALLLAGLPLEATLQRDAQVQLKPIEMRSYADLLSLRQPQRDASGSGDVVELDAPLFSWPAQYQGAPFQADWHLGATGILEAWGLLAAHGAQAIGAIKVGHIDTGITPHPALGWSTLHGPWVKMAEGVNYFKQHHALAPTVNEGDITYPALAEYDTPRDNHIGSHSGHGTRTASTLAGLYVPASDPSKAYFGAAPGAAVVPYRITDSVFIDHVPDLLAAAIRDAVAKGCQVISISLGALRPSRRVARAIDFAYDNGVIICAAAGNVIDEVIYPGRFNRVLTVGGATTPDGHHLQPWAGASRGKYVDVSAPSDQIRRATTMKRRDGTERFLIKAPGDGTSFGTALVAGIAVLWLAHREAELTAAYGTQRWARVAAFKRLVRNTSVAPDGWDTSNYGAGVVQAGHLLRAALPNLTQLRQEAEAWAAFDMMATDRPDDVPV